jgi:hypothetical protein
MLKFIQQLLQMYFNFFRQIGRILDKFKMLRNPAGERNKQPILETLQQYVKADAEGNFLEISSGEF